jgi:hypothetical protein
VHRHVRPKAAGLRRGAAPGSVDLIRLIGLMRAMS